MTEDIRPKKRFNRINDISETNKDDLDLKKIKDNLEKFVQDVLREENITPYELSRRTNTHETLWKNVVDGRTQKPDTGAIVALADYKKASLDEVISRDISKEKKVKVEIKQTPEISAAIAKLSKEALQEAMLIGEKTTGYKHKPSLTEEKKSFMQKINEERTKQSSKPKGKSI